MLFLPLVIWTKVTTVNYPYSLYAKVILIVFLRLEQKSPNEDFKRKATRKRRKHKDSGRKEIIKVKVE